MVQPIQYQIPGVSPDPFAGVLQGLKIGGSLAEMDAMRAQRALQQQQLQQQIQQRQLAMEQQQRFQTGIQAALANPNRTWQDLEPLLAIAPNREQADAVKTMMTGADARVLQNNKNFAANLLLAIESDPQVAKQLLDTRIEAEPDPQKKQFYQTVTKALDISPQQAGHLVELGGAQMYGKDWYEGITKVRGERRAAELQPFKMRQETADAIVKEAQAKLAPEKFGAELGLTQAQIEASKAARRASDAAAAKSGAEAKRAQAEADQMAVGVIPADKRPEAESKIRKEYSDQTKGYQEVKSAYGRVLASDDSAVGDLSLIFGYMKMLDPGSVVREGEFATAQNATGVPERIVNLYNKIVSGERLNASQRKAFKGQAERLFKQAGEQESVVRKGLERIAKGYGLNIANIFYEPVESVPTAPAREPAPPTPPPPVASSAPVVATPEMRRKPPLEEIFTRPVR